MKNFGKWKKWSKTFFHFSFYFVPLPPMRVKALSPAPYMLSNSFFEKLMKIVSEKFGSVDKFLYICSMLNYKM